MLWHYQCYLWKYSVWINKGCHFNHETILAQAVIKITINLSREVKRICTAVECLPRDKRTHQLSWISVMGSCAVQLTERNMWTFIPRSTLRESRKLQNRQGQSILVQTKNVLLTMITSWEQIECDDIMRVHFSFIRLGTFTVYKIHIILSTAMPRLWNKTMEIEYSPSFHGYHNIFPWWEVFISKLPIHSVFPV